MGKKLEKLREKHQMESVNEDWITMRWLDHDYPVDMEG